MLCVVCFDRGKHLETSLYRTHPNYVNGKSRSVQHETRDHQHMMSKAKAMVKGRQRMFCGTGGLKRRTKVCEATTIAVLWQTKNKVKECFEWSSCIAFSGKLI